MQLTAAVINAGIGDLSLGLAMAGYHIVTAYETEEKAIAIHQKNLSTAIYPLALEDIDIGDFPEVDVLAARIYQGATKARNLREQPYEPLRSLLRIMEYRRPRAFLLMVNYVYFRNEEFQYNLNIFEQLGYQITHQKVDVSQTIGYPVKESAVYIAGLRHDVPGVSSLLPESEIPSIPIEAFLEESSVIDPWYFKINWERTPIFGNANDLLCWKKRAYMDAQKVNWDYMHVPLINDHGNLRRLTHREIARLKGFPDDYRVDDSNKQWLYKKLMYAGNVVAIKQIAGMISYALTSNPWRSQQQERELHFEGLFGRYLERLAEHQVATSMTVERETVIADKGIDFSIHQDDGDMAFEVKYYRTNQSLHAKLRTACKQIMQIKEDQIPILVVANEVPPELKERYLRAYGVHIWDVENLLWLFEEFPDIKNEFVAFLDYAVDHIVPKPPVPEIIQPAQSQEQKEPDWKERLLQIPPGKEHFRKYEELCTDILKYILGEYLTLWKKQESSNDGLYRFDLCCKIKSDVNQDFFDTIKNYFHTKYVVFEFKNYKEEITQKEIYTTEKYLYEKALRKVAIILSRSGADEHAQWAAKGALRENGKLILCLSDSHLLEMIDMKTRDELPAEFLSALLDDLLVHLEK